MKALGVHVNFSPVMDVNNNPDNPIVNIRSYGSKPGLVSEFGSAYIRGLQSEGVAATAKHFPGHGDTDTDSHHSLPIIDFDQTRLNRIELPPFKAAVDAGAKLMMIAHMALPQFENGNQPASLNPHFVQEVLRDSLGFEGVVITDGMGMGGITREYWPGEAAVKAIKAGCDIVLLPPDFELAYNEVLDAVKEGQISEDRIDQSVRRVLELKRFVNVEEVQPNFEKAEKQIASPQSLQIAEKIYEEAVTLVRDPSQNLPLHPGCFDSLATVIITDDLSRGHPGRTFIRELGKRFDHQEVIVIGPGTGQKRLNDAMEAVKRSEAAVAGVFVRHGTGKNRINLPREQADFMKTLLKLEKPIVTAGFGTPYLLRYLPQAETYITGFGASKGAQIAVAQAIAGEIEVTGKLPIALPSGYDFGHGLERRKSKSHWSDHLQNERFKPVFDLVQEGIADSVAPGMAVYIAQAGSVLVAEGFGHFTYDNSSPKVERNTVYDLASITKVAATTPLAMRMVENNLLHLDKPVSAYWPEFSGGQKDKVTIRHLLTHSSGLPPYIQFWKRTDDPDEVLEIICDTELQFEPGSRTRYSDLGIILLGKILEKLGKKPLGELTENHLYQPLGMQSTGYQPGEALQPRITPTEYDSSYRSELIRGEVHDENAALLGGIAGHAGLFSTIDDLGRYGQMLLRNGYLNGNKFFRASTIDTFTTPANVVEGSTRALGWDTPSEENSLYGNYTSKEAFGHTGFTGTSILIDPGNDAIVILLTNRVHPTRENYKIRAFRPEFHNTVMKILRQGDLAGR